MCKTNVKFCLVPKTLEKGVDRRKDFLLQSTGTQNFSLQNIFLDGWLKKTLLTFV